MTGLRSGWTPQVHLWSLNFVLHSTSAFVPFADSSKGTGV